MKLVNAVLLLDDATNARVIGGEGEGTPILNVGDVILAAVNLDGIRSFKAAVDNWYDSAQAHDRLVKQCGDPS